MNRKIASVAAGVTLALSALSANASHIAGLSLFDGLEFTFDGTSLGGASEFTATAIDFSYVADVDQTKTGATTADFSETGVAFFSTFQYPLGSPVSAATTGLNNGYKMYLVFTGTGDVGSNGFGGINGEFDTFNLTIYIDPSEDSATVAAAPGAPGETTSVSDPNGDDFAILTGTLEIGGFHVFPGLANGDFDVLFNVTSFDAAYWGGAAFAGPTVQGDINGVNTSLLGFGADPFGDTTDLIIRGSGNVALKSVPVPGVLGLMGAGLLGLGLANRRRK